MLVGRVMEMRKTMRSKIAAQSGARDPHQDPSRALADLHGSGQGLRMAAMATLLLRNLTSRLP